MLVASAYVHRMSRQAVRRNQTTHFLHTLTSSSLEFRRRSTSSSTNANNGGTVAVSAFWWVSSRFRVTAIARDDGVGGDAGAGVTMGRGVDGEEMVGLGVRTEDANGSSCGSVSVETRTEAGDGDRGGVLGRSVEVVLFTAGRAVG